MSSWEFGWEALVAIGTLTLAFFTWRLARQTGDLARETANEVRSNARPVLVAAAGTGARLEVGGPSDRDYGTLVIPVRNAGRGPALNAFAYAITTTREGDARTNIVNVGNVPSDGDVAADILGVKNVDATDSWERDGFLAIRAVIVYSDLAGAQFHTVVRLSDPEGGARRVGATQWIDLTAEGTASGARRSTYLPTDRTMQSSVFAPRWAAIKHRSVAGGRSRGRLSQSCSASQPGAAG